MQAAVSCRQVETLLDAWGLQPELQQGQRGGEWSWWPGASTSSEYAGFRPLTSLEACAAARAAVDLAGTPAREAWDHVRPAGISHVPVAANAASLFAVVVGRHRRCLSGLGLRQLVLGRTRRRLDWFGYLVSR